MKANFVVSIDWLLRKAWAMKLVIIAGFFTGAEALIQAGIDLPGSKSMPTWGRGLLYMVVVGGGFVLRWYLMRDPKDSSKEV